MGHKIILVAPKGSKVPFKSKNLEIKLIDGVDQPSWQHQKRTDPVLIPSNSVLPKLWEAVIELENQSDSTFIDTLTIWGQEYFYKIETITIDNFSRSSIIKSNIFDNSLSNEININASNNLSGRINLNWNHNLQEEEFYQIEIWRTNSQNIDPINDFLLATITDYEKNMLDDSYLIGDGITWFYKLKLKDNFGNINVSEIQAGNSLP